MNHSQAIYRTAIYIPTLYCCLHIALTFDPTGNQWSGRFEQFGSRRSNTQTNTRDTGAPQRYCDNADSAARGVGAGRRPRHYRSIPCPAERGSTRLQTFRRRFVAADLCR